MTVFSTDEVAKILGLSSSQIRSTARAARHQLGNDDALHAVDLDHAAVLATCGRSTSRR